MTDEKKIKRNIFRLIPVAILSFFVIYPPFHQHMNDALSRMGFMTDPIVLLWFVGIIWFAMIAGSIPSYALGKKHGRKELEDEKKDQVTTKDIEDFRNKPL